VITRSDIHLIDFDGRSVLERRQLEAENEKLRVEVERLRRVIAMMNRHARDLSEGVGYRMAPRIGRTIAKNPSLRSARLTGIAGAR